MRATIACVAMILPTPCTQPGGCPELVKGGGLCEKHRGLPWRPMRVKENHPRRIYDRALWKRLKTLILAREPTCRSCAKRTIDLEDPDPDYQAIGVGGVVVLATRVDHIVDVSLGGLPWSSDNLQPLCIKCHNRKTARTFGFGKRGAATEREGG